MEKITPEMLLNAYANGLFPMADSAEATELYWYDPPMRGILPLDGFHIPKRLQRDRRNTPHEIRFDHNVEAVIRACAENRDTWINSEIISLYSQLAERGFCHSVECWMEGELAGGVYGISLGGAFFGESMFSRYTNASKFALIALVEHLNTRGFTLLDCQFTNDHLKQFGIIEIPKVEYLEWLEAALQLDTCFT